MEIKMRYLMIGEEWKDKDSVYVDIRITLKSIVITPLSPKPKYTYGCIDDLWDIGKMNIHRLKPTKHVLRDWGNGRFTLYPHRAGIPYALIPKDEKTKVKNDFDNLFGGEDGE